MKSKRLLAVNLVRVLDIGLLISSYISALLLSGLRQPEEWWSHLPNVQFSFGDLAYYAVTAFFWSWAFTAMNTYQSYRFSTFESQRNALLKATVLASGGISLLNLLTKRAADVRFLILLCLIGAANELIARGLIRLVLRQARVRGRNLRWLLIVGINEMAREFGRQIEAEKALGYIVAGFIYDAKTEGDSADGQEVIGSIENLPALLRKLVVDEVAISLPMHTHLKEITYVARLCRDHGIITRIVADSIEPHLNISRMDTLGRYGLLTVIPESRVKAASAVKTVFDVVVASALLVVLSPLIVAVAVLIRLTSTGPIFYHQVRLGENKRSFRMHKFRTMVVNAEDQLQTLAALQGTSSAPFKMRNDPRVTRVGRFLRKFSLDEVPQLFNVLKLEMSLVGPRPLPVRDYEAFERDDHFRRFSVKPGLSCLWQISGRSDLNFEEWMKLDMEYIDQWSIWLDLKILMKTVPAVIRGQGAY